MIKLFKGNVYTSRESSSAVFFFVFQLHWDLPGRKELASLRVNSLL